MLSTSLLPDVQHTVISSFFYTSFLGRGRLCERSWCVPHFPYFWTPTNLIGCYGLDIDRVVFMCQNFTLILRHPEGRNLILWTKEVRSLEAVRIEYGGFLQVKGRGNTDTHVSVSCHLMSTASGSVRNKPPPDFAPRPCISRTNHNKSPFIKLAGHRHFRTVTELMQLFKSTFKDNYQSKQFIWSKNKCISKHCQHYLKYIIYCLTGTNTIVHVVKE